MENIVESMLLIQVRWLDNRYHGEDEWPPSPARLFQALVAGNAVGAHLPQDCVEALRWLEAVPTPPEIRAQRGHLGLRFITFVPNNDLDTKEGDPERLAELRVEKTVRPRHIDNDRPLVYAWRFAVDDGAMTAANHLCQMANHLYQLGRGVDMAWAQATVLDAEDGAAALGAIADEIFRPGRESGPGGIRLACPQPGSLASLLSRYQSQRKRLVRIREKTKIKIHFTNAPKARFRPVSYNTGYQWCLFDLRSGATAALCPWPQERVVSLVEQVRDKAAERLRDALPDQAAVIDRLLIGRNAAQIDKNRRVHLIPLPSIGHERTNRSIRRLLVMVPPDCPLPFGDIEWAFSGLMLDGAGTGETILVHAEDLSMLRHYAFDSEKAYRLWRSVTPTVLPQSAARRRIDPAHRTEQAKPGSERMAEEQRAAEAVLQALRHAEVEVHPNSIRVQREPFSPRSLRAEVFAADTRFSKERLWHVELRFAEALRGPLVIGDGRYVGLGVLAPVSEPIGAIAYQIESGQVDCIAPSHVAQALRRAAMARTQHHIVKRRSLPSFFTGHASDGSPLREGHHAHLAFAADLPRGRLLVIAPYLLEGRSPREAEQTNMEILLQAMQGLRTLRVGPTGSLDVSIVDVDFDHDPIFGTSRAWRTITSYRPTRYAKSLSPAQMLETDVVLEIARRGLPKPQVDVLSVHKGPRGGLVGSLELRFTRPVRGPILIGRTRHVGEGLFAAVRGKGSP